MLPASWLRPFEGRVRSEVPLRRLTTWRMIDRVFQQHQVPFNVTLEVGGWEVIKRYVELDFGISITTGICLRKEDRLISRKMNRYFPKRSYGIVERRGRHLSLAARAFLEEGNKVMFTVIFRGREMARQDLGTDLLKRVAAMLDDCAKVEKHAHMEGRRMHMIVAKK